MIDLLSENEKLRSRIAELSSHQPGAGVRAADFDEILPETVWESDPQGRLTYVNAAGLEAFGFSTEDILNGVNLLDVIAPDDQPRARENISKRLRGEDEGLTEYIAIRKDGSTFPMLIRTTRILEGGEAIGLRGLAVDASKQKQIERDLLDNEARLNQSQKIARLGSWKLNIKTGKVWWSREHYSLLGLDSDTYSPNWKTVQELVHLGDVDVFTETGKRATKSGAPAIAEVRMRHSDGHFLDIRSHIHWKSKDTLVGTLQDVTDQKRAAEALKESEEKYRTLVDVSPDAVIIHSGGILRYVKGAGLEMFGLKDLESVVGRSAFDFVHRSFHESVKERIVTIQNEGGTAALVEELFLRSDGTPFWAESTACAVTIGEERSILLVLRDVTSRKELEDKLRQTEKLEVLGTLAGGVAVDFNNALHAMLGYCAVALSQPETHSNPVFRTSLKGIEESGNRASDLVGQILKFARVTDSERERVNIQPIVLDAVEFLRKSLPSSIEVQSKMERDALYVNAGPTQIYQLMLNICTNSSQAIGKEHGRLEIHVYERRKDTDPNDNHDKSENGGTITILIHDTGSGMDKRTRDRAFEPFFTTKAVGEGTGLGLSTVHGIVQSLGGSVRIDSELGEGTTVSISLPVSELSVEPEPPSPEPPEPEPISPSGLRVLFVDDEPKIVEMSVMALERNGMVVEGFTDPEAALDAFRSKPDAFDIVISDLTMPNVTGLELASHIGELNPRVPMLLCSGSFVNSTIDKTQRSTIRERLQKPI